MLIYTYQKSKKKKKTKKEIAQYEQWLASVNSLKTNFSKKNMGKITFDPMVIPKLTTPPGRETVKYPSVVTPGGTCTKPIRGDVYTGTAMKGIGTLHKSNAVPIFSNEEAIDQANMRR
jgi:hypothetical protein